MRYRLSIGMFAVLVCVTPAVSVGEDPAAVGRNVVLWISIDGFRGDYVDRGRTPFIDSLMEHGLYSRQLVPVFPSLTFPSHVSEATGVLPGVHGIVSNKYLDTITGEEFSFSTLPQSLRAEPIWTTASRQGRRTAVIDWPLSEGQEQLPADVVRTSYFSTEFDPQLTDRKRLELLANTFRTDFDTLHEQTPLQLLKGYACEVDKAGHKMGPQSAAVDAAIGEMDQLLFEIVGKVAHVFNEKMNPAAGDALWVLVTTDHGMSAVEHVVHARHLLGDDVPESVFIATSGGLAHVYFNRVPATQRETMANQVLEHVRKFPFATAWHREELPAKWQYDAPGRTGDVVISLAKGYTFGWRDGLTIAAIDDDRGFPRGMHSYDPNETEEMRGVFILTRWGSKSPGRDVGELDTLRIHPTVAKLLDIQPAEGATAEPLDTSAL